MQKIDSLLQSTPGLTQINSLFHCRIYESSMTNIVIGNLAQSISRDLEIRLSLRKAMIGGNI